MRKETITFDFDITLKVTDDVANDIFVALFRHLQVDNEIHIVTTRTKTSANIAEINGFLDSHGLNADGVWFTNHDMKIRTLSKLDSCLHFDDDPDEIALCRNAGIVAVNTFRPELWDVWLNTAR